jgi:hypothetical protein
MHHPRGMGPPPLRNVSGMWSTVGPLGAAMRLTALRQSPKDIFRHPKHSGNPKSTPNPQNDFFHQLPCDCKPISADTDKCGSARPRDAPYGGAKQAPRKLAYSNPLHELPTLNAGTCIGHPFPYTSINKLSPPSLTAHRYPSSD